MYANSIRRTFHSGHSCSIPFFIDNGYDETLAEYIAGALMSNSSLTKLIIRSALALLSLFLSHTYTHTLFFFLMRSS